MSGFGPVGSFPVGGFASSTAATVTSTIAVGPPLPTAVVASQHGTASTIAVSVPLPTGALASQHGTSSTIAVSVTNPAGVVASQHGTASTAAVSVPVPTAVVAAQEGATSTIAVNAPVPAAVVTTWHLFGTMSATNDSPVAVVAAQEGDSSTIAATTVNPTAAATSWHLFGIGAASPPLPTAVVAAQEGATSTLSSTVPAPIVDVEFQRGTVSTAAATAPLPTALVVSSGSYGTIAATNPLPNALLTSDGTFAAIAAPAARPVAVADSQHGTSSTVAITLVAPTPVATSLHGTSSSIPAVSPAPVAAFAVQEGATSTIAVNAALPTAVVAAQEGATSTITVTAPLPSAVVASNHIPTVTSVITGSMARPTAAVSSSSRRRWRAIPGAFPFGVVPFDGSVINPPANVTSTLVATAAKPTAVVTGLNQPAGSISVSSPRPTVAIAGAFRRRWTAMTGAYPFGVVPFAGSVLNPASNTAGAIAASLTKPTSVVASQHGTSSTVTVSTVNPSAVVSAQEGAASTIAATTVNPTASATSWHLFGTISASPARPTAAVVASHATVFGTISATTLAPTAVVAAQEGAAATISVAPARPTAVVSTTTPDLWTIAATTVNPRVVAVSRAATVYFTGGSPGLSTFDATFTVPSNIYNLDYLRVWGSGGGHVVNGGGGGGGGFSQATDYPVTPGQVFDIHGIRGSGQLIYFAQSGTNLLTATNGNDGQTSGNAAGGVGGGPLATFTATGGQGGAKVGTGNSFRGGGGGASGGPNGNGGDGTNATTGNSGDGGDVAGFSTSGGNGLTASFMTANNTTAYFNQTTGLRVDGYGGGGGAGGWGDSNTSNSEFGLSGGQSGDSGGGFGGGVSTTIEHNSRVEITYFEPLTYTSVIAGASPAIAALLAAGFGPAVSASASNPLPVATVAGNSIHYPMVATATTARPTAAVAAQEGTSSDVAATLARPTIDALASGQPNVGTVDVTSRGFPVPSILLVRVPQASVAVTLAAPSVDVEFQRGATSTIAATIQRPSFIGNAVSSARRTTFSGAMAETLVVNRALTVSEREKVEGYMAWKWHQQTNLHPNHPYRYEPPSFREPVRRITIASPMVLPTAAISVFRHQAIAGWPPAPAAAVQSVHGIGTTMPVAVPVPLVLIRAQEGAAATATATMSAPATVMDTTHSRAVGIASSMASPTASVAADNYYKTSIAQQNARPAFSGNWDYIAVRTSTASATAASPQGLFFVNHIEPRYATLGSTLSRPTPAVQEGDPFWNQTELFLRFQNTTTVIDSSRTPKTLSYALGNVAVTATPYGEAGGRAARLDASSGHFVMIDPTPSFNVGTGDFTLEFWLRANTGSSYTSAQSYFKNDTDFGTPTFTIGSIAPTTFGGPNLLTTSVTGPISGTDAWQRSGGTGVWQHFAFCRRSGVLTVYVDGTSVASTAYTASLHLSGSDTAGMMLMSNTGSILVDDIRITTTARYNGNFAKPTVSPAAH